jgi:hypothetical protein
LLTFPALGMTEAKKKMSKSEFKIANPETLKLSEEISEELATKLALISGVSWDTAKENLDRTLEVFGRFGSSANAHKIRIN